MLAAHDHAANERAADERTDMSAPSIFTKIAWRSEALAYDIICLFLKPFSFAQISNFGGKLLRVFGPKSSKHKRVLTGLKLAFPNLGKAQRDALALKAWDNIGRTFAEFPIMNRIEVYAPDSRVTVIGREVLTKLIETQTPAVIVTGHFANWEIMAAALTQSGLDVHITYRKINNPYLDARVKAQREAYGTKFLVQKSTHAGARMLLRAIENNESVALLNDQKFNEGISVPFFGHGAMTATGAVRLALKTGAPLVPISVARNKSEFTVTVHDTLELTETGARELDIENGVKQIIAFTEEQIRKNPDQWFWVHRRWPKALYK